MHHIFYLQSKFVMDGDKLVQTQKWGDKETTLTRYINGEGQLVVVSNFYMVLFVVVLRKFIQLEFAKFNLLSLDKGIVVTL